MSSLAQPGYEGRDSIDKVFLVLLETKQLTQSPEPARIPNDAELLSPKMSKSLTLDARSDYRTRTHLDSSVESGRIPSMSSIEAAFNGRNVSSNPSIGGQAVHDVPVHEAFLRGCVDGHGTLPTRRPATGKQC